MNINVFDENSQLKELVVGNSFNFKSQINFRDLYDPISLYNYLKGSFPNKYKLQNQISNFKKILLKYNIKIHDLEVLDTNQIFVRDLGFVIDNKFFISSILPDRELEIKGLKKIMKQINNNVKLPKNAHIEGGDVVLDENHIFIGYYGQKDYKNQITARTNKKAIKIIRKLQREITILLKLFAAKWDDKYPVISDIWERNWSGIIPFIAFTEDIRKVIYTTNSIESVNSHIRKIIKNKGVFPNYESF